MTTEKTNAAPTGSGDSKGGDASTTTSQQQTSSNTNETKGTGQAREITSMLDGAGGDAGGGQKDEKKNEEATEKSKDSAKTDAKDETAPLELKLPDALKDKADEAVLGEFKTVATKAKLTSEQASDLAGWWLERQAKAVEAQDTLIKQQSEAWLGEIKKDTEFGGGKLAETHNMVLKAFAKFGDADTSKALTEMGLQNFPGLVKMFARIGRALAEDKSSVRGNGPSGSKPKSQDERIDSLYDKPAPRA
jgi:hypothetical protein